MRDVWARAGQASFVSLLDDLAAAREEVARLQLERDGLRRIERENTVDLASSRAEVEWLRRR